MAINKRKDRQGRFIGYQVVLSVYNPATGKAVRRSEGTFLRRKDADIAERKAKIAIQNGAYELEPPEPAKVWTVATVVEAWLAGRKATVSANTIAQYESAFRIHLNGALGDRDIATLTRADVKAVLRTWQAGGMGAQLQHRAVMVLRCALDEAVEDGIAAGNPAAGITLPSPKKRRDVPHWTPEHLRDFLAEGEQDQLGVFWHLAAIEGMRRSEILGLRWSDLRWSDESSATATIAQTVIPDMASGGAPVVQPRAKTRASQRTVTLTRPTVAALKRHRDRQAFQRQARADVWPDGLDLIVANEVGGVVRPDAVTGHRRAVIARAGVPDPGTHGLRHGAITAMLRSGVSPAIVAEKIGHSDIGVTVGTYGHLVPADQGAANQAMEAFLDRAASGGALT